MAKRIGSAERERIQPHRKTSIGSSVNTSPKNKSKKRNFKAYRGQGK